MARQTKDIRDIDDSKDLWKIVVRIRDLWSVTSVSNKEHLEAILIDAKCGMIQVIIPSHLVTKHKSTLIVGNIYMQNFKVANNDFSFKSITHSFKLIFCGATSVKVTFCLTFL
ncbi:unnamed protein product [Lathyrus oleraceus]